MDNTMKKLLFGGAIFMLFTFIISYKVSADFTNSIQTDIQAVKAQNEDLKAELCQIKDLLNNQVKHSSYRWSASTDQADEFFIKKH
jgi:hypothetical protein